MYFSDKKVRPKLQE